MDVSLFDFDLPDDRIAQRPLAARDASRLMVLPRREGPPAHRAFRDLPELLRPGDLLVVNDARVIPARLLGRKVQTGGKVDVLLCEPLAPSPEGAPRWRCLATASKAIRAGVEIAFAEDFGAVVEREEGEGWFVLQFRCFQGDLEAALEKAGRMPLPPYIRREEGPDAADAERYQTVYARVPGAVAAPTAGLHFTEATLQALRERGVRIAPVTLHVGPGTFTPVRAARTEDHRMHSERYHVPRATADAFVDHRRRGGRVIAVGTTALRTLEAAFDGEGLREGPGETALFLKPGDEVRAADGLVTNFHLPRSTLVMLVAALAGRERLLDAYRQAIAAGYRFYSYGDAMLVL